MTELREQLARMEERQAAFEAAATTREKLVEKAFWQIKGMLLREGGVPQETGACFPLIYLCGYAGFYAFLEVSS